MQLIQYLLPLFLFFSPSHSKCAFTQKCDNAAMGDCHVPYKVESEPQIFTYTNPFQCPEFADMPVCCNDDQNTLLKNSFNLIGYTFGSGANGCDLCGANLERFWCWFTCAPNQGDFVKAYGPIIVPNPFTPGLNLTVCNVSLTIDGDTACELYQSCKKTPFVSQVSAMNSAEGLLNFMGNNAVSTGLEKITMEYTTNASMTPLNLTLHGCNETYYLKDNFGYPIAKNCSCNNCDTACGATADIDAILTPMNVMEGFDSTLIIAFYCAVIGEILICVLGRKFFKGDQKRKDSKGLLVENQ